MEQICKNCKKEPVKIKKWELCTRCYSKLSHKAKKSSVGIDTLLKRDVQITYASEMLFVKRFFTHNQWHYQPAIFRVNGFRYEPDFYDCKRGVFIEVSGTRQAFHANKDKYKAFVEHFPHLVLEIRHVDGELLDLKEGKFHQSIKI